MLSATCHCGAIRIDIPQRPTEVTNCNCSICRRLGCLWAPLDPAVHGKLGVNIRNFEPGDIGDVRIRLLDGADTWNSFCWEDLV